MANQKIKVEYTDGTEATYDSIAEAEAGIVETVTGCNFAATVQQINQLDPDGEIGPELYLDWSVSIRG